MKKLFFSILILASSLIVRSANADSEPVYCLGNVYSTELGSEGKEVGQAGLRIWSNIGNIRVQSFITLHGAKDTLRIYRDKLKKGIYKNHLHYTGEGISVVASVQDFSYVPHVNLELSYENNYWQGKFKCKKGSMIYFP